MTGEQQAAVQAEGDVLVVAGAGTGKTRTLVERCLARIQREASPVGIDRMLIVTFTEAAAAELRKRIRSRLEEKLTQRPGDARLTEQLALLEVARISTLHGFCLGLVRDHFHRLSIDPEVTVLSEEQAALVARESLDVVMRRQYGGEIGDPEALQELVMEQGRGWDEPVRKMILRLHRYTRSLCDPTAWYEREMAALSQDEPETWREWLLVGFEGWRVEWLEALDPSENPLVLKCRELLLGVSGQSDRAMIADVLAGIMQAERDQAADRKNSKWLKPLAAFLKEAAFLEALFSTSEGVDPLRQDWSWVRGSTRLLLELACRFGEQFAAAKRALGAVDFADLEQLALELLWDRKEGKPTGVAEALRRQLDLVFVDEYQDINEAQDTILRAVSREGAGANRFLVGDVKQSIYRFRLADPRIFQDYLKAWRPSDEAGQVLLLTENFRSHEWILEFVNNLFGTMMRTEVGGVEYDQSQHLRFGAKGERVALSAEAGGDSRVELHLLLKKRSHAAHAGHEEETTVEISQVEREAGLVGRRLRELMDGGFEIWDTALRQRRRVKWQDMAILMRAPRGKAEAYAKVFERLQIPLRVARGGFYETTEVTDLLNILRVLDNPLQDLPLLGVLRSPWAGLTPDELAKIRLLMRAGYFWTALRRFHRENRPGTIAASGSVSGETEATWRKVDRLVNAVRSWRRRIRQEPLSGCVESILDETGYEAWLLAQPRGEQRLGNLQRFLGLTRQFDEFQRQGLYRFLGFVEAQTGAGIDVEPAPPGGIDAVQLSSIHQSKGLEYPVVVLADLGKSFNMQELHASILLDEEYGLCTQVRPPGVAGRYPSLPYWLAQRRQRREALGEELRLFYVGCTRACDLLILCGSISEKRFEDRWNNGAGKLVSRSIAMAGSYLDWLGSAVAGGSAFGESGERGGFRWRVYPADESAGDDLDEESPKQGVETLPSEEQLRELGRRVKWRYPFVGSTGEPAKTTVSALRRRAREMPDEDTVRWLPRGSGRVGAEVGEAYHLLLEGLSLAAATEIDHLRVEAKRLLESGHISSSQHEGIDLEAVAAFWRSEVGERIRGEETRLVHRELPFTARFEVDELTAMGMRGICGDAVEGTGAADWVIVQGVVDLAVVREEEIWVLDFKTDRTMAGKVEAYAPQLRLYARALERIYRRPVTHLWLHFFSTRETVALRR